MKKSGWRRVSGGAVLFFALGLAGCVVYPDDRPGYYDRPAYAAPAYPYYGSVGIGSEWSGDEHREHEEHEHGHGDEGRHADWSHRNDEGHRWGWDRDRD